MRGLAGVVGGVIVLPAAPRVTLALATADAAVASYLIGPGSQADMTERIGELESSRARAVGSAGGHPAGARLELELPRLRAGSLPASDQPETTEGPAGLAPREPRNVVSASASSGRANRKP